MNSVYIFRRSSWALSFAERATILSVPHALSTMYPPKLCTAAAHPHPICLGCRPPPPLQPCSAIEKRGQGRRAAQEFKRKRSCVCERAEHFSPLKREMNSSADRGTMLDIGGNTSLHILQYTARSTKKGCYGGSCCCRDDAALPSENSKRLDANRTGSGIIFYHVPI
jgi:hypothetical protein